MSRSSNYGDGKGAADMTSEAELDPIGLGAASPLAAPDAFDAVDKLDALDALDAFDGFEGAVVNTGDSEPIK